MSKPRPERALPTIAKDTREPDVAANDHPDSVFRPRVFGRVAKGTPYALWPRVELPTARVHLDVGDYSLPGLEGAVSIERKSGLDLLQTLFGEGMNSCGERAPNIDRFRAEIERAYRAHYALFAIVCEASVGWLYKEAGERFERYGKSFDPPNVLAILRSFAVDLACPTIWAGSKGAAEIEIGETLARVHEQATGGDAAKKAHARGYAEIPWLDKLKAAP